MLLDFGCVRFSLAPSWKGLDDFTFRQTCGHSHAEGRRSLRRYDFVFDIDMGAAVGTRNCPSIGGQDGETLGFFRGSLAELDETDPNQFAFGMGQNLWYIVIPCMRESKIRCGQLFWRWSINISILIGHFIHEFGWKLNKLKNIVDTEELVAMETHWTVRVAMEINHLPNILLVGVGVERDESTACASRQNPLQAAESFCALHQIHKSNMEDIRWSWQFGGPNFGPNFGPKLTRRHPAFSDVFDDFMPQLTAWWFGTMEFMTFHILGVIIPTDEYFSEGLKTPTSSTNVFWEFGMDPAIHPHVQAS